MTYNELKYHLPVFLFFFSLISILWTRYRLSKSAFTAGFSDDKFIRSLKKVNKWFNLIFSLSCIIVVFYSFFPDIYHSFSVPFHSWDIPALNNFGVMILNISLIWIIVTQMILDIFLFRILSGDQNSRLVTKLVFYSQKCMLMGFVIMFIGMFLTISSLLLMFISIAGVYLYYRYLVQSFDDNSSGGRLSLM